MKKFIISLVCFVLPFWGCCQIMFLKINQFEIQYTNEFEHKYADLLSLLNLFVQENYPNKAYPIYKATPVFLHGGFNWGNDSLFISYGARYDYGINDIEELKNSLENIEGNELGLKVGINPNNIEETLKLIEYAITHEKKLKRKFYISLRENELHQTNEIEMKDEDLEKILTKPSSKMIRRFLVSYSTEIEGLQYM